MFLSSSELSSRGVSPLRKATTELLPAFAFSIAATGHVAEGEAATTFLSHTAPTAPRKATAFTRRQRTHWDPLPGGETHRRLHAPSLSVLGRKAACRKPQMSEDDDEV